VRERTVPRDDPRRVDVGDYHRDEQCIEVRHRPQTDTPTTNKKDGERLIALPDGVCMPLDGWLEDRCPNVADDYGREPLVATTRGRANKSALRTYVYPATRPCFRGASVSESSMETASTVRPM
jgi:hypothetical protein